MSPYLEKIQHIKNDSEVAPRGSLPSKHEALTSTPVPTPAPKKKETK
jgi:hypothetical protein